MKVSNKYALITGSSRGIGRALAYECVLRGKKVLLISNEKEELSLFRKQILQDFPDSQCHYFSIDLTDNNAPEKVYKWTKEHQFEVDTLINNVGFGRNGFFKNMVPSDMGRMINLNNRVMTELTYHFLPDLEQLDQSHILNMSSIEASLPLPYKSMYTATKHFVYAFSLALREEVKPFGISVSVLCPGPVVTNEDGRKRMQLMGKKAKLLVMYPEQVAKEAITGMLKGKDVIVPGQINKAIFRTGTLLPRKLKMRLLEKIFRSYQDE